MATKTNAKGGKKLAAQEEKIYHFTQKEMDDLLDTILASIRKSVKEELKQYKEEKKGEKKKEDKKLQRSTSTPDLKKGKELTRENMKKKSAQEVKDMAQKKAKKEKTTIKATGKGKNPTKEDNIDFYLGEQAKGKKKKVETSDTETEPPTSKKGKKEKVKKVKKEDAGKLSYNKKIGVWVQDGLAPYQMPLPLLCKRVKTGTIRPLSDPERKKLEKKGVSVCEKCSNQKQVDRIWKMVKESKEQESSSESGSDCGSSSRSEGEQEESEVSEDED